MQPKTIKSKNNNIFENGRRPQLFKKEDVLNFFGKWRQPEKKVMQPKTIKSKNNNIFENGRRTSFKVRQPKIFESGRWPTKNNATKNN